MPGGQKAVDIVAIEGVVANTIESSAIPLVLWLIEAKDFRIVIPSSPPKPSNVGNLPHTMVIKVTDTMAGLADAAACATNISEQHHAMRALAAPLRRIVLHLEPHTGPHTHLFPIGFSALVLQSLKILLRSIDKHSYDAQGRRTVDCSVVESRCLPSEVQRA